MTNFRTQGNVSIGGNISIHQDGSISSLGNLSFGNISVTSNGDITTSGGVYLNGVKLGAGPSSPVVISGTLWDFGLNNYGQLGQGNTTNYSSPVQVGALTNWASVACGGAHTVAIKTDGTLWVWGGYNSFGQLGLGDTNPYSSPAQVGALTTWESVASGGYSTMAIKTDGTLWGWGNDSYGQLGLGTQVQAYSSPVQVGSLTNWKTVGCGILSLHTLAIKTDGTLWAWGKDNYGQLGQGNTTNYSSPVQVGALTNWASVAAGQFHTAAIKTDGTLWTWGGYNVFGQLGQGNTTNYSSPVQVGALTNWASVTCGRFHTAAIKTDGTLWAWGYNNDGELGLGNTTNYSSPVQVGALTNWASVAGGQSHTTAIKTDGTLWAWGNDSYGQLGQGNTTNY